MITPGCIDKKSLENGCLTILDKKERKKNFLNILCCICAPSISSFFFHLTLDIKIARNITTADNRWFYYLPLHFGRFKISVKNINRQISKIDNAKATTL